MVTLAFTIYDVNPVPKKRARHGKYGSVYTPSETVQWENLVRQHAAIALNAQGLEIFTGELGIIVTFYRVGRVRVDTDNLLKSIKDAGNGVLYKDDNMIMGELTRLYRGCKRARVDVLLMPIHDFDMLTTGVFNEQLKALPE